MPHSGTNIVSPGSSFAASRPAHRPRVGPPRGSSASGLDIALVGAVFAWQIRRISFAELPELRAIKASGVIALFLVLFSGIYLAMSNQAPRVFTRPPRSHAGALLHDHRLLDGRLRRHHSQDGHGMHLGCLGSDVARPRHHRRRGSPHLRMRHVAGSPPRRCRGVLAVRAQPEAGTKMKAASAQSPDDLRATT